MKYICGIDEVGRGPLAGPVAVGAFCVATDKHDKLLAHALLSKKDSKKLSGQKRRAWRDIFKTEKEKGEIRYAVSMINSELIDRRGIAWAIKEALKRSLQKIEIIPEESFIFLDGGLRAPKKYKYQKTVIGGDAKIPVIACASIVAKVARDSRMENYSYKYPEYGFEEHKGYGTYFHRKMIRKHGLSKLHRRSFLRNIIKK